MEFQVSGSGFWVLGFRFLGSRFWVSGFRFYGSRFRVENCARLLRDNVLRGGESRRDLCDVCLGGVVEDRADAVSAQPAYHLDDIHASASHA